MWALIFLRLHGGIIPVKKNEPKVVKGLIRGKEIVVTAPSPIAIVRETPVGWGKQWNGCKPRIGAGRTNTLNQQLLKVIDALEELHIDYYVSFGTLIGVLRDGGMNPNEVDNDIVITRLNMTLDVYRVFHKHGLHIFLQDVWRVCFTGGGARYAAWDVSHYYPYTDIYDRSTMWRLFKIRSDMKNRSNSITCF